PALGRPGGIHGAACLLVPEDAIAVGPFPQRHPALGLTCVHRSDFFDWPAEIVGDGADFFGRHPDVARIAGAAVAAPRTLETEPVAIPRHVWPRETYTQEESYLPRPALATAPAGAVDCE